MKKLPAVLAVLVLGTAGFAAASIASGANLLDVLTGTTETGATTTAPEGTTTGEGEGGRGRRVLVCHATHSRKHPYVQIMVNEHALKGVLKHGGYLGACTGVDVTVKHGHGDWEHGAPTTGTNATTTTTSTDSQSSEQGHGQGDGHGNSGGHGHGHGHG